MRAFLIGWAALLTLVLWGRPSNAQTKSTALDARPNEVLSCTRDPRIPDGINIWVILQSGKLVWDTPALFYKNLPKDAVIVVYRPDDPRCPKNSSVATTVPVTKPKDAAEPHGSAAPKVKPPTKVDAHKTAAGARKKEAQKQANVAKEELAARENKRSPSKPLASKQVSPASIKETSAPPCSESAETEERPAPGIVRKVVTLVHDQSGASIAPVAPAPAPGIKQPEPLPPEGKDYAAKKAAENARHAAEEVDRRLYELGGRYGTLLGEAEAGLKSVNAPVTPNTSVFNQRRYDPDPSTRATQAVLDDALLAAVAKALNALPDLPTYTDPTLAVIAQKAFERGYGAGVAEAGIKAHVIDEAAALALALCGSVAAIVEREGATALRGAVARLRGIPIFVPGTAVGGAGGFVRIPKSPCKVGGVGTGSGSVPSQAQALIEEAAELKPYRVGGGHHVPAKSAFEGASGYDPNTALAIPNAELERLNVKHRFITPAQMQGYQAFAKTGEKLTWEAMAKIETNALIKGGMSPDKASATVRKAIDALKSAGIKAPTRIPWSR